MEHLYDVFTKTQASAGIISSMLYSPKIERNFSVKEIKEYLQDKNVEIRPYIY